MAKEIVPGHKDFTLNEDGSITVPDKITGVTDPTAAQDAATKNYVDTTAVLDALFDAANTILKADVQATPEGLTIAEQRLVGRITDGVITGLTGAQVMALLSGQAGAAFSLNSENLNYVGHIGAGGQVSQATVGIYFSEILTGNVGQRFGAEIAITAQITSAAYSDIAELFGGYFGAYIHYNNTQDWTKTVGLYGVLGIVGLNTGTAATKTITGAASFYADASPGGAYANDMLLTNLYGLYVEARSLVGNDKLTNCYGIKVEDQEGGATLNYAIHTGLGLVHFGDAVDIDGAVIMNSSLGLAGALTVGAPVIFTSSLGIAGALTGAGATFSGGLGVAGLTQLQQTLIHSSLGVAGLASFNAGIFCVGNIAVGGTVDGVDISVHATTKDVHMKHEMEIIRTGEYFFYPVSQEVVHALAANIMTTALLIIPRDVTVDRIAIWVNAASAGKVARIGIYEDGTNLYPGDLLIDAGEVSVATTGTKAVTISQALTKGIYHVVVVTDGTPGIAGIQRVSTLHTALGIQAGNFTRGQTGWTVGLAYTAGVTTLPDPFTGGGTLTTVDCPLAPVRLASLD